MVSSVNSACCLLANVVLSRTDCCAAAALAAARSARCSSCSLNRSSSAGMANGLLSAAADSDCAASCVCLQAGQSVVGQYWGYVGCWSGVLATAAQAVPTVRLLLQERCVVLHTHECPPWLAWPVLGSAFSMLVSAAAAAVCLLAACCCGSVGSAANDSRWSVFATAGGALVAPLGCMAS